MLTLATRVVLHHMQVTQAAKKNTTNITSRQIAKIEKMVMQKMAKARKKHD